MSALFYDLYIFFSKVSQDSCVVPQFFSNILWYTFYSLGPEIGYDFLLRNCFSSKF